MQAARTGDRAGMQRWLERADLYYDGNDSPLIALTKGQANYHLGDYPAAAEAFKALRAQYGDRPFKEENPDFLRLAKGQQPLGDVPEPSTNASAGALVLDDATAARIDELSERGNGELDDGNWRAAADSWHEALALVPEPKSNWEAADWLWTSLADAYFAGANYRSVLENTRLALLSDTGNAFAWLRQGQALHELDQPDAAADSLTSAFMLEGLEFFEDEDPKYLAFLRERGVRGV